MTDVSRAVLTEFGHAAAASLGEGTDAAGPYDEFNRRSAPVSKRRPKARYKVTPSAHLALGQRKLMTDRMWDAAMAAQFKRPGA